MKKRAQRVAAVSASVADVVQNSTSRLSDYFTKEELFPYIAAEDLDALRAEVLTSINNELVHAEELELTVPRLLQSCANEAREVRRAMNALTSSQIVESSRSLATVQHSLARVKELRELFIKQGRLISGMKTTAAYHQLRQLHFVRKNISEIIDWAEALREVRYENIYEHVEAREFGDVYKRLCKLQRIRRTVISRAGAQYRTYQGVFEPYFAKLDIILSLFVAEVVRFLEEESIRVAIQKALEDPEEDGGVVGDEESFPEFVQLRDCVAVCGEELHDPSLNFGSSGEVEPPLSLHVVRAATQKSLGAIWESEVMGDVVDPIGQLSEYLDNMRKVEALLPALELSLLPLSDKFPYFATVVQALHAEVTQALAVYLDEKNDVDANGLMKAMEFARWYKSMLVQDGYAQYVTLAAIDEQIAMMVTAAVGGMSAHLTRLCRACSITVCNDPSGPTALPTGQLITNGPMDLFSILQQSLAALTASVELHVMQEIGRACAAGIRAYLDECKLRSDFDYWEDENNAAANPLPEKDWTERRAVLLYAFCNDCSTIENNLESIELRFASCWSDDADLARAGDDGSAPPTPSATSRAADPFVPLQDYIPEVALYYLDEITAHVERVVGGQWSLVFRSPEWYGDDPNTNPVNLIVQSIAEYIGEEFTVLLHEARSRKIIRQMVLRFTVKYLNTLLDFLKDVVRVPKKYAPGDWNAFVTCVSRDIEASSSMWEKHVTENRGHLVELARHALEVTVMLLRVSKVAEFDNILQKHLLDEFGDCPTFVIHLLLQSQQGLEKESRERMIGIWQERIAYQRRDKNDAPTVVWSQSPSFFASVDKAINDPEKRGFFSNKSNKKKREMAAEAKRLQEKEEKRAARAAKRAADAAGKSFKQPVRGKSAGRGDPAQNVEVTTLKDLFS